MKRLFFLAAGMFAMGCEDYLFAGLLPGLSESLDTSIVAVAQGCVALGVAYLVSIPLCACLLARYSGRMVLIAALVVFIFGNVITLLSQNFLTFIVGRFVAGLGSGLFLPVAVAAGIQLVEPSFRGRALSVMWGANSAGAVCGVPLGLWFAHEVNWRATVALILILAVFALIGIGINHQPLRVEAAPPSLGEQFRLLTHRRVLAVVGVTFLTATGCLGLYSYVSQVLFGTENSSDLAFSLWSIGGLMGTIGVGYVLDRFARPQLVMVSIIGTLFLIITAIPLVREVRVFGLLPFLIWGALGWASVTPQQLTLIEIKADHEAILVALNSSAVSLGSVVGTALLSLALSGGLNAAHLPYVTSFFLLCAFACQILLVRKPTT